MWVDDPHFKVRYHVRHTALPRPGGDAELKRLAGRVFSQALDRSRPLWELWLVEGLADGRFALLSKTHHALVDGVSGVDIATVLFDTSAEPLPVASPEHPWVARPLPTPAQLLADALLERTTVPAEVARGVRAVLRGPRAVAARMGRAAGSVGALAWTGLQAAPPSPFNVRIGPHRRFTWVRADLSQFKAVKNGLGGTVNDVVLAAVAGALGRYMRRHELPTDDVRLRAMVPVSIRADIERGALGNRVAAMWATLPVGVTEPAERLQADQRRDARGQAVGPGRRGRDPHPVVRLRAAHDHGPGGAPAGSPAPVQPGGDQRSRDRSSRCICWVASSRRFTRWCRWRRTPRWGSRFSATTGS